MDYSLKWNEKDSDFFICLLAVTLGFITYYLISKSEKLKVNFKKRFGEEDTKVIWIVFERFIGAFFFGVVPLIIIFFIKESCLCRYGLSFKNGLLSIYWILGLSPVLIVMNFFNCKKPDNLVMYPQIRKTEWNLPLLVLSAITWMVYLFAYEFMFRGYLLFVSLEYLGIWSALALNITIYALVHLPKGPKEAIGAIPFGFVLGLITIKTGGILVAFVVHVVLALSNEWLSIWAHPEIKFVRKQI